MVLESKVFDWRTIRSLDELKSPYLLRLVELWRSRVVDGRLPGRLDFSAEELISFHGRIALLDVEQSPRRYRFRLIGSFITEVLDRDSTGKYLDELYRRDVYGTATAGYEQCILRRAPIPASGRMVHANRSHIGFEAVDIPLASNGLTVDMIMKGTDFS